METHRSLAPAPEVQYLPALFRQVQQGQIRIPAFQREFVWSEAQVIELLESVFKGFPIGSLLFWKVHEPILRVESFAQNPFPILPEKYPMSYVLDGLQRLSALYGVFHNVDDLTPSIFNVVFNLDEQDFLHFDPRDLPKRFIRLSSLFSPKQFLESQRQLSSEPRADELLDRAVNLHATFQQYLIPTVTISDRPVTDVVAMFERINSTGTRLNAVDFMRAITWSEDFDLNAQIAELEKRTLGVGYEIPPETLVKIIAVILNKPPIAENMLELRELPPDSLKAGVKSSELAILRTIRFLADRFRIMSYDYVPYEGQMLVLTKIFHNLGDSGKDDLGHVESWFWTVSFNEEFRGKPDHFIARTLQRADRFLQGQVTALAERLSLTPADLIERRFIRGKALSGAIAALFAVSNARSLITGQVISPGAYMAEFSAANYEGILPVEALPPGAAQRTGSNKILANIVVTNGDGVRRSESVVDLVYAYRQKSPQDANGIFRSQLMPEDADSLLQHSPSEFLEKRAQIMFDVAAQKAAN